MARITKNRQKYLIFIAISQLQIADGSRSIEKRIVDNTEDGNNNENIIEALNNDSDRSTYLLV